MNTKQRRNFPHLAGFYDKVSKLSKTKLEGLDTSWAVCAVGNRIQDDLREDSLRTQTILKIVNPEARRLGYAFSNDAREGKKRNALTIINKVARLPSLFCSK